MKLVAACVTALVVAHPVATESAEPAAFVSVVTHGAAPDDGKDDAPAFAAAMQGKRTHRIPYTSRSAIRQEGRGNPETAHPS